MKPDARKILEEAMRLEPGTRALIAETLLESLDFEEDFEISQAWHDEIRRRIEQIDRGEIELIDSDTVMGELRKKHAADLRCIRRSKATSTNASSLASLTD
ncbi:addiction module protein [Nitrospira sp. Nam80]